MQTILTWNITAATRTAARTGVLIACLTAHYHAIQFAILAMGLYHLTQQTAPFLAGQTNESLILVSQSADHVPNHLPIRVSHMTPVHYLPDNRPNLYLLFHVSPRADFGRRMSFKRE